MPRISGTTAVVGVGVSDLHLKPKVSKEALALQAFKRMMDGLPIKKADIDGLVVTSGAPVGVDYDKSAEVLGLNVRFTQQTWAHGRFSNPGLHTAAMAVFCGMAEIVLCLNVYAWGQRRRVHGAIGGTGDEEAFRIGGGPHGENPLYGLDAPMGGAAVAYQRYLSRYGYRGDEAAELVTTQRANAVKNPGAAMRKPLSKEEYLSSPFVIWPLRRPDCSLTTDGAVAILVTTAERARDLTRLPAYITGMQGIHSSRNEHSFGAPWLGIFQQDDIPPPPPNPVFQMANLTHKDIAAVEIYDAFLPQIIATFERFGFCPPGEALRFMQDGRISLTGEIPVNTSGGHLSEGHLGGWGQVAEAVRQVRGECGERQLPNAHHTMYAHGAGDFTIFSREPVR